VPQLILLAIIAMSIDVILGAAYILAGNGLARAIADKGTRLWVDRAVGAIFLVIALAILADLLFA
jgi:threonine/homoserine/homoserine lactone efflux protein